MTHFIELHTFYANHRILLNTQAIKKVTPERKDRDGASVECSTIELTGEDYENVRETYDEIKEMLEPQTDLRGGIPGEVTL